MHEFIEKEVPLAGVSVLIGVSEWASLEDWICPESSYVVCQRLSDGHSPVRIANKSGINEIYPQVRSLGFMPSTRSIRMYPLERPLRTLNCFFNKDFFEEMTEVDADGWYERAGSFMALSNRRVEALMQTIHGELLQPGFAAEQLIEAASTMIAVEMARLGQQFAGASGPGDGGNLASQGLAPWQLRRIRERLDAALELGYPRIQELAELCGISRGHLMRMFKASTGQSIHRYIMREKLNLARHMLAQDQLSIKEIAALLGFCNTGHFTTAFRQAEGMTPSDFRSRARAGQIDLVADDLSAWLSAPAASDGLH